MAVTTAEEPKPTYALLLTGVGIKKIQVIREVRAASGLGLKQAKDLVDQVSGGWRKTVVVGPIEVVQRVAKHIESAGGTTEICSAGEINSQERYVLDSERLGAHIRAARELAVKLGDTNLAAILGELAEKWTR